MQRSVGDWRPRQALIRALPAGLPIRPEFLALQQGCGIVTAGRGGRAAGRTGHRPSDTGDPEKADGAVSETSGGNDVLVANSRSGCGVASSGAVHWACFRVCAGDTRQQIPGVGQGDVLVAHVFELDEATIDANLRRHARYLRMAHR
jgi:hypothetical protein